MTEICKKCGEILQDNTNCIVCREPIQMICKVCKNITEEFPHQNCKYELQILRIFPISPDNWFDKYQKTIKYPEASLNLERETTESKKSYTIISIAKALEKMGRPILEQICYNIYSKHNRYLADCYDNHEYLIDALRELFGKSYQSIIRSIEENVQDHDSKKLVREFFAITRSTR